MREKHYFNQDRNFWINVQQNDVLAVKNLKEEYGINDEMLTYSLDKNERARVEYDSFDEVLLLLYQMFRTSKKSIIIMKLVLSLLF
jgi:Mg2+ and Co2+ transporter CorA